MSDSLLGQLVEMPDKYINKEVKLNTKKYIPMRYYVLMDKDTGSTASTFCNVLQYKAAALLVGEPMRHNALKYGEVIRGYMGMTSLLWSSLSTMEINEHTKAINGVVMPDITIAYVAADYLSGEDAMLDKIIEIIKQQNNKGQEKEPA